MMHRHRRIAKCTIVAVWAIMLALTAGASRSAAAQSWRIAIIFIADADQYAAGARGIGRHLGADLTRSGRVTVLEPAASVAISPAFDAIPNFAEWRRIGAEALVIGHLARAPDGRLKVAFRLWDVSTGTQLLGRQYSVSPGDLPDAEAVMVEAIDARLALAPASLVLFPR
jgi:TolB protein